MLTNGAARQPLARWSWPILFVRVLEVRRSWLRGLVAPGAVAAARGDRLGAFVQRAGATRARGARVGARGARAEPLDNEAASSVAARARRWARCCANCASAARMTCLTPSFPAPL